MVYSTALERRHVARHREFESLLLRPHKNERFLGAIFIGRRKRLNYFSRGERFEALLPYLRTILIVSKWERGTAPVRSESLLLQSVYEDSMLSGILLNELQKIECMGAIPISIS